MIALIGMPGSGKSTLGRQLARELQLPLVDLDQALERRLGSSIREYFEHMGEPSFRDAETALLDEVTSGGDGVLSTGGGVVVRQGNRDLLRRRCRVIYLHVKPEALARRVRGDKTRPLLQVENPLERLRQLFKDRDPLYRETAHVVVDATRRRPAQVLAEILEAVRSEDAQRPRT